MRSTIGNAGLAWVAAGGFLLASAWPTFSESQLPLIGLSNLSIPRIGWPLTLVALAIAAFLSIPPLQTRDRLLVCAGFSLCLFFVVALYASPVAAIIFAFLGGNVIRESRSA